MILSRSIHVAANGIFHSFLWLSNIPLYTCTTSFFFLAAPQYLEFPGQESDPSCIFDPSHKLWQHWIPRPLFWAGDQTCDPQYSQHSQYSSDPIVPQWELCVYHIFIYSSVNGRLDGFHVLAFVNISLLS